MLTQSESLRLARSAFHLRQLCLQLVLYARLGRGGFAVCIDERAGMLDCFGVQLVRDLYYQIIAISAKQYIAAVLTRGPRLLEGKEIWLRREGKRTRSSSSIMSFSPARSLFLMVDTSIPGMHRV